VASYSDGCAPRVTHVTEQLPAAAVFAVFEDETDSFAATLDLGPVGADHLCTIAVGLTLGLALVSAAGNERAASSHEE